MRQDCRARAADVLRHANLRISGQAEILHRVLPELPTELLEQMIEADEAEVGKPELRALPAPE